MYLLPLLAPVMLVIAAVAGFLKPGRRPGQTLSVIEAAAITAIGVAIISTIVLVRLGAGTSPLIGG